MPVTGSPKTDLSAPFMAYFGVGAFAKFHIGPRWEVGADFMFRHYSNGRLALPNEAINALGAGVFARYRLSDPTQPDTNSATMSEMDFCFTIKLRKR